MEDISLRRPDPRRRVPRLTGHRAEDADQPRGGSRDEHLHQQDARSAARMYWAVADCLTMVRRGLLYYRRQPSIDRLAARLPDRVGAAVRLRLRLGDGRRRRADYKDFAMPGMFAMTMAFGFMNTA